MGSTGHVTRGKEKRIAYRGLVEKFEGITTLGRHSYRKEDNIKRVFNK